MTIISFLVFSPRAFATQELRGDRISVVYDNPALAGYAQEVAVESIEALDVITEILNFQPRHITLVIDDVTDSYNAVVIPTPNLKVALRPLYPTESQLGFRTENNFYSLMLHELMHAAQLTYIATESSEEIVVGNERSIFNAGEVASVPPAWFLEGIATWVESAYGGGGRLNDAFTIGIIQSLALEDALPTLEEVSLITYGQWPYGRSRYLFGASFTDYIVQKHGLQSIIDMLHVYNRGGIIGGFFNDFSSAWFTVTGVPLSEEWSNWQKSMKSKALLRSLDKPKTISNIMSSFPSSRLSPDAKHLVWVDGSQGIMMAELTRVAETSNSDEGAEFLEEPEDNSEPEMLLKLDNIQVLLAGRAPYKIDWYSEHQLVYSRTVRDSITSFQKVFVLDINSGEESLFSSAERLKGATTNPVTGCVFTLRDVRPEPSLLVELCPESSTGDSKLATVTNIWQAPNEAHFLSVAISEQGDVLLSLWDAGKTDIALFDPLTGELDLLLYDVGQDLDPYWRVKQSGETSIIFRSDRHLDDRGLEVGAVGVFDVYELEPRRSTQQKHRVTRLSRSLGGAFQPISFDDDTLIYTSLGDSGFQIATLDISDISPDAITAKDTNYLESPDVSYQLETVSSFEESYHVSGITNLEGFTLQAYQPVASMLPYAVSPTVSVGNVDLYNLFNLTDLQYFLGGTTFSEDITGKHSFSLSGGLNNILTGHWEGQYLFANYRYSLTNVLTPLLDTPVGLGLSFGVWPHFPHGEGATETALGAKASLNLKMPNDDFVSYANLNVGLVNLQSRPDDWFLDGSARLMISKQRRDTWDYVIDGYRSAVFGVVSPSEDGLSGGLWATTSYHENVSKLGLSGFGISGIAEAYLQAGYNAPQPVSVSVDGDYSIHGHIGLRHTINTGWRYGDGLHAIERVSFEPRVRSWHASDLHVGADIGLYFDTVVNYLAPISVGVQVGYADGLWYSWGLKLPNF